jgi:hypothetical protein
MLVTKLLQKQRQLGHCLCDLHVGQIALEEDGAFGPLRAFVVEGIGAADGIVAGFLDGDIFCLGHR